MSKTKLHFQLPKSVKTEEMISALGEQITLQIASQQHFQKTFYDSFDWRLFCANVLCELNQSKTKTLSQLRLSDLPSGQLIASTNLEDVPEFAEQFGDVIVKNKLASLLEMRALIPLISLECQVVCLNVLNDEQKTTVRILIEDYGLTLPTHIHVQPIRGYDKAAKRVCQFLERDLGLKGVKKTVLESALQLQGRQAKDYSSKLNIRLDPTTRADIACKTIYSSLALTIRKNEAGTLAATDSEFLHDFRVAVRRTRSGLSQLKAILPEPVTVRYKGYFAWLGQITGTARDLDVYLLNFPAYKSSLPVEMQQSLDPLFEFIQRKQRKAYRELAAKLKSSEYVSGLRDWEDYLQEPVAIKPGEANALHSIKQVADQRISKVYRLALKEANAITEQSPAEALHELRKTCKKLRYLMEFFQNLYPENKIAELIKALKNFQNILGDFQDYQVQEETLKHFAEEMATQQTSAETFIVMGVLVQNLHQKREQVRQRFAESFAQFKQPANEALFHALFASKG